MNGCREHLLTVATAERRVLTHCSATENTVGCHMPSVIITPGLHRRSHAARISISYLDYSQFLPKNSSSILTTNLLLHVTPQATLHILKKIRPADFNMSPIVICNRPPPTVKDRKIVVPIRKEPQHIFTMVWCNNTDYNHGSVISHFNSLIFFVRFQRRGTFCITQ